MTPPATECDREVKSSRKAASLTRTSASSFVASPLTPSRTKARPRASKLVPHSTTFSGPPINTNLSTYDRTDPFSAFNTLLKLLGSLSSRVGALQYRISPAEHKLSLHLLAIIEPFLGTELSLLLPPCTTTTTPTTPTTAAIANGSGGPVIRRRTLTRQPTEILDSITTHIDTPRDLLSFSQTCRRIYDVVFPRHIYYRVIRCKVSSIKVWHHLSTHKSLARNVRKLEIIDERAVVNGSTRGTLSGNGVRVLIPPDIQGTNTDFEGTSSSSSATSHDSSEDDNVQRLKNRVYAKQERLLVRALLQMSGLETFIWSSNHSPISVTDLWPTLIRCQSLKSVDVANNLIFKSPDEDEDNAETAGSSGSDQRKSLLLPGLESVSFRTSPHPYGSSRTPALTRISSLVGHCPRIKSLDITYTPPRNTPNTLLSRPLADELLLCNLNRWSTSLTHLTLLNLRCQTSLPQAIGGSGGGGIGMQSLARFLASHPCLEVLNLDIMVSPAPPTAGAAATAPTPALAAVVAGLGPPPPPGANPQPPAPATPALAAAQAHGQATPAPAPAAADSHYQPLLILPPNSLPHLRELKSSRDMITAILSCPSTTTTTAHQHRPRPLESLSGFRLSGALASLSSNSLSNSNSSSSSSNSNSHNSHNSHNSSTLGLGHVSGVAALRAIRGATRAREADQLFLDTLKCYSKTMKSVEMVGWTEMEDVRRIAECLPFLTSLDVGRKIGGGGGGGGGSGTGSGMNAGGFGTGSGSGMNANSWNGDREVRERDWNRNGNGSGNGLPPVTNPTEWANVLKELPELEEVKGIRFFYEVPTTSVHPHHHHQHTNDLSTGSLSSSSTSSSTTPSTATATISYLPAPPSTLSTTELSRMKKNNEVAGMLVWKCPKLRRTDYWEEAVGRVVLLAQDSTHVQGSTPLSGIVGFGNSTSSSSDGVAETKQGKVRWGVGRVRL